MRTKLLIATLCVAIASFLVAFGGIAQVSTSSAQPPSNAHEDGAPVGDARGLETPQSPSEGQMLIRQAEATLQRHHTISSQITQKSHLLGCEVIGSGAYFEQRSNQGLRFRLELNVQTRDDKLASGLLQVCDGRFLWNYRKLRGKENLSCVDYALVQQRLEQEGMRTVRILDHWPGLGGLPKLLRSFDKAFVFGKPEGVELQDDFPAWKVEGHWRPEMLAKAVPEHKEAIEKGRGVDLEDLPEHLPNCVVLFLGKDDLFPYSIVYYRLDGNTSQVTASPYDTSIVKINMTNVRFNTRIHAAQFVYKPSLKYTDDTEQMLEKLGLQ